MNKEYVVIGESALVSNQQGEIRKVLNHNDLEKKLQLENNFEYLNNLISEYEKGIDFNNVSFKKKFKDSVKIILSLNGFAAVVQIIFAPVYSLFMPVSFISLFLIGMNIYNKFVLKSENEILKTKLNHVKKEINKLEVEKNKLKKEKSKKSMEVHQKNNFSENVVIKKVDNGIFTEELNQYLNLIELYERNKQKYLMYYENCSLGIYLSYLGLSSNSIGFIAYLIEKDLEKKEQYKKRLINKF